MKLRFLLGALLAGSVSIAHALPALQLGGDPSDGWTYDTTDQTWDTSSSSFTIDAYANATTAEGGNGDFAWDSAGANERFAYLVFAATPGINVVDAFDLSLGGTGALSLVDAGYGRPPVSDNNDLSPHGIYDTYYEIYEFQFDGAIGDIADTQPGETGTGKGYMESFDVTINLLADGVSGVHMDLFTVYNSGDYVTEKRLLGGATDNEFVKANAPYSHDAEFSGPICDNPQGCDPTEIPEPGTTAIFGLGLLGLIAARRRFSQFYKPTA